MTRSKTSSRSARVAPPPDSTSQRLLDAAVDVFAERGYDGTSIREIVSRASANVAALNYHWGSKERLWLAVCERSTRWFIDVIQRVLAEQSVDRAWPEVLERLFDELLADPRPLRVSMWASLHASSMDYEATGRTFQPLVDLGRFYVKDLERRGLVGGEGVDVDVVLPLLKGMFIFAFVDQAGHRQFFGKDFDDPELATRFKRALIRATRLLLGVTERPYWEER
ncbi:MAG: TetR/AcrR family transcriptional regulator [Deltaproteobacteria bacterium]|nr:TetR/AcrR family transcriptional regulator [Deltaproteobacteria bacterium]